MTQNKTELQEDLDFMYEVWDRHCIHLQKLDVVIKAAQNYADLPEKVMGLQTYLLSETQSEILINRDDILTLLENQDENTTR